MSLDLFERAFPVVLNGFWITVLLTLASFLLGQALALPLALARDSSNQFTRILSNSFVFVERGSPLLIQLFIIYYGLASVNFIQESFLWPVLSEPMYAAILAIGLNSAAYTSEVLRGAIKDIPKGQYEAALAVGLSNFIIYKKIILPQVYRNVLPVIGNESILVLKSTSIVSTITLMDITGISKSFAAKTYAPFEVLIVAGIFYLALAALLSRSFHFMSKKVATPSY
ncbi:ABC transporter permease [Psychromonas sp.]|uniref:ABC transporter permease n=1 Tax=Psychromonas sp. TaxID=1884585 RepID=UPI003A9786E1